MSNSGVEKLAVRKSSRIVTEGDFHILVNRIGYDGSVVSDSNDYARSEKVLRDLEKKYHLTQVVGSREAKEHGMSNNEILMMKRTNDPSVKVAM